MTDTPNLIRIINDKQMPLGTRRYLSGIHQLELKRNTTPEMNQDEKYINMTRKSKGFLTLEMNITFIHVAAYPSSSHSKHQWGQASTNANNLTEPFCSYHYLQTDVVFYKVLDARQVSSVTNV